MMNFLIKIFIFTLFFSQLNSEEINEVIFTIDKSIYTNIDLENRKKYLKLLNKSDSNKADIMNDYVSVTIFNEFAKRKKIKFEEKIINKYYSEIKKINENIELSENIIRNNIKLDYQRKIILEKLVSNNLSDGKIKNKINIFDLYNLKIKYFVLDIKYEDKIDKIIENIGKKKISYIRDYLSKNKIENNYYEKKILNTASLDTRIKNEILNNKNIFYFKNDYITLGIVEKKIKENLQLKFTLYQVSKKLSSKISGDEVICDNLEEDNKYKVKKFEKVELTKLNEKIKNEINFINDKIKVINESGESIIILCKIDYDTDILEQDKINNKINYLAKKIEKEFIEQKKIDYNYIIYE